MGNNASNHSLIEKSIEIIGFESMQLILLLSANQLPPK